MAIVDLQIADSAEVVTPGTTLLVPGVLFVGTGGDVEATPVNGQTRVFKNVPDGSILYVMVKQVLATNTTAEDILILR
jgi:hypothetical protein